LDKGTRVRIIAGRQGEGAAGTVFWTGPSRYGEGLRLGVRGDDGQTYWVDEGDVEETTAKPPPVEPGPTLQKGDRVAYDAEGRAGTGSVFWIGQSRQGPGQRLGIRDDDGGDEPVWLDARFARPVDEGAPAAAPAPVLDGDDDEEAPPDELAPQSREMPPMDDGPPADDAWLDSLAAQVDDEDAPG